MEINDNPLVLPLGATYFWDKTTKRVQYRNRVPSQGEQNNVQ